MATVNVRRVGSPVLIQDHDGRGSDRRRMSPIPSIATRWSVWCPRSRERVTASRPSSSISVASLSPSAVLLHVSHPPYVAPGSTALTTSGRRHQVLWIRTGRSDQHQSHRRSLDHQWRPRGLEAPGPSGWIHLPLRSLQEVQEPRDRRRPEGRPHPARLQGLWSAVRHRPPP